MEKDKIIERIVKRESLCHSKELLSWIQESSENLLEYIRYKNTWALLQHGKEMNNKFVTQDFNLVKRRLKIGKKRFVAGQFLKYAAMIIISWIGGYFVHSLNLVNFKQEGPINEISVPFGNRSLVVLPDGSKVWLANGSKISYPEDFTGKARDVKLEGEAYFTVSHDQNNPFIVNLGEHRVKVLGTEFSVVAYPDDNILQVDLVSGKVQLDIADPKHIEQHHSHQLDPSHRIVFNKKTGKLSTDMKIPDSFYKYWQEGVYEFNNESFESLAEKIERIYNMKVVFLDPGVNKSAFTGAFHIDANFYTVIETFRKASRIPFNYRVEKNKIYIEHVK